MGSRRIYAADQHLSLVHDAELYPEKQFILEITDPNGRTVEIALDGVQVGDLVADARDAGLPATWPFVDGVPRDEQNRPIGFAGVRFGHALGLHQAGQHPQD